MSQALGITLFKPGDKVAGSDLQLKQFHAVKVSADGDVDQAGAGEASHGILQNKPDTGVAVEVEEAGLSKAVAGAAIASAGVRLMANAAGRLIAATSTNEVIAISRTTASGDGAVFTVKVLGDYGHILA